MHYCDHALSVVRHPSSVRPSSVVNFSHFRLLIWNRWTEFNKTWQKARSQRLLPSLCFSGRWEKQDGRPGLWLAETFSTSPLKPLNRIQQNLTGSKILTASAKFVFFGPIGKTRWPPWALIGWDIFDFSSETAERNSTKLDRTQDLNVLYQVCVFGPIGKTRWLPWPLIGWDIFDFSSETAERYSMKLDRKQDLNVLYQVCVFRADRKKTRWPPWPLIGWDIFDFSSETAEQNSMKLDKKQDLNVLYQVCVFRADRKNKMAALASDWLRHFRLLLWNRWTEFNETWQEARSQRPLPSLCFSGRSEKQDGRPGLWLAETFSTSPLKPLNGIQRNLTRSKISTSSTKFVFFGPIGKTRWPPWPLIGWHIFDFSSEPNSTKLDRKQDLNVLYQVCVFWVDRKNKMAALASNWLRHFRLLLWNCWTEFNETWQEARSQRPLPSVCFSGRSENKNGRPERFLKKVAHCTQVHDMWPFWASYFRIFKAKNFFPDTRGGGVPEPPPPPNPPKSAPAWYYW